MRCVEAEPSPPSSFKFMCSLSRPCHSAFVVLDINMRIDVIDFHVNLACFYLDGNSFHQITLSMFVDEGTPRGGLYGYHHKIVARAMTDRPPFRT